MSDGAIHGRDLNDLERQRMLYAERGLLRIHGRKVIPSSLYSGLRIRDDGHTVIYMVHADEETPAQFWQFSLTDGRFTSCMAGVVLPLGARQ